MTAGLCAVASGLAYLQYFVSGASGDWAITAWNLLIIPAALVLGLRLASRGSLIAAGATAAGIAGSVLWAFDFRTASVEPWWIALAAAWWLGLGWLLRKRHRATAWLTLALGIAATIDLVVTILDAPLPWLAVGGLKLPLTTVWSVWIGVLLIRQAAASSGSSTTPKAAGAMAVAGGAVWVFGGIGWLLTHGTQPDPSTAELFALRGTEFTQLLAVASLLWAVAALTGAVGPAIGRLHRAAAAVALLGTVMVGLGAILETSVVDPDRDFLHPAVQGGWLLFIGGLFPVMCVGLLGLAVAARQSLVLRTAYMLAGVLAPLPVLAFSLGSMAASATVWVAALAAFHAAPGLGWMAVGQVRISSKPLVNGRTAARDAVRLSRGPDP